MDGSTRKKAESAQMDRAVDQFLQEKIDTVPHLEALLLLWNSRPRPWSVAEMADGLFLEAAVAKAILDDLVRNGLIVVGTSAPETYLYGLEPERDIIVQLVDSTYRRELVRVSRLIHSKAPAAVREFARAFRLKKENI